MRGTYPSPRHPLPNQPPKVLSPNLAQTPRTKPELIVRFVDKEIGLSTTKNVLKFKKDRRKQCCRSEGSVSDGSNLSSIRKDMANEDFVVKLDLIVKKYSTREPASLTTLCKSRPKINRKVGKSQNLNVIKNEISISRAKAICSKKSYNENLSGEISVLRRSCRRSSDIVKRASEDKLQLGENRANFIRSLMSQSKEDINRYFSNSVILFDDNVQSKVTTDGTIKT
jgi:hypothetical protein